MSVISGNGITDTKINREHKAGIFKKGKKCLGEEK